MTQNIIVIGPAQSGKTFLINQLTRTYFEPFRTDSAYVPTIGIDIVNTNIKDNIKYIYIDSSGQDRFLEIIKPYFQKCDIVLIVFDLSSNDYQNLQKWYDWAKCRTKPTIVVGSKHDLIKQGDEKVLMDAVKFAQERECPFFPTSSVTGVGITELRNSLQNLVPAENILLKSIKNKKVNTFTKKSGLPSFKSLFCCFQTGYTVIDEEYQHQPKPIFDNTSAFV